jgi:uncharacterized protein YndB with AHSA1/START domain
MTDIFRYSIFIAAEPENVFDYFLVPELMVQWMGDLARLDAKAGGLFSVDINGVLIRGNYTRIERPKLLEFSWGQLGNDEMPPGTTQVLITLAPEMGGTLLSLAHSNLEPAEQGKHAIGWPHFIERLVMLAQGMNPGRDPWADMKP